MVLELNAANVLLHITKVADLPDKIREAVIH